MDFTVRHLSSSVTNFPSTWPEFTSTKPCLDQTAHEVLFWAIFSHLGSWSILLCIRIICYIDIFNSCCYKLTYWQVSDHYLINLCFFPSVLHLQQKLPQKQLGQCALRSQCILLLWQQLLDQCYSQYASNSMIFSLCFRHYFLVDMIIFIHSEFDLALLMHHHQLFGNICLKALYW